MRFLIALHDKSILVPPLRFYSECPICRHQNDVMVASHHSNICLMCGLKNEHGANASFAELDNNEVAASFTPEDEYQGYPDRLRGAITMGLSDEAVGRVMMMHYDEDLWAVHLEFTTRFEKTCCVLTSTCHFDLCQPREADHVGEVFGRAQENASRLTVSELPRHLSITYQEQEKERKRSYG